MTPNNNLNVLPFYDSLDKQDYKKFYAYGNVFDLIAPNNKLLPFQISTPTHPSDIAIVYLWNIEKNTRVDITSECISAGIKRKRYAANGYDLIINDSALIFPNLIIENGLHYIEVRSSGTIYHSEVFSVKSGLSEYLKLEYYDSGNIEYNGGHIEYTHPFKNYCYLKTAIGKPEYPFEEVAQKRDGFVFIEKQISEKKYKFEFVAPEYMCDALRIVRMHDYINIYYKGQTYNIEDIVINPKWKEQGNLAVVEVEFECDTVVKKIGRGNNTTSNGEFNADFNADFNN